MTFCTLTATCINYSREFPYLNAKSSLYEMTQMLHHHFQPQAWETQNLLQ